jgi:ADP-heptose:LPS heptosyltransferase
MPQRLRIAVYCDLDLLGDGLMKLPFVRALRSAWPDGDLTWVAGRGPSVYAGVLRPLVHGLVDRTLENTGVGAGLGEALRRQAGGLDILIDTQSLVATAWALRQLGARQFFSRAGRYLLSSRRPPGFWRKRRRLISRLLYLAEVAAGRPVTPTGELWQDPQARALAERLLPDGGRYVALVAGAGGRHKAWPLPCHIELARALAARGVQPAIILGPAEREWHPDLAAALPEARFPLQEAEAAGATADPMLTLAVARRCLAGVAGDCGGGHLLAAADLPLVSLFGPTEPDKFAPWTPELTVLRAQSFGGTEMTAIPVAAVLVAVEAATGRR